jgi:hypothetical protein
MPKPTTNPTLYDDLIKVTISFLKKNGYLKLNQWRNGTITWSRDAKKISSISIKVNTQPGSEYLELDYKCNGNQINYKVELVSVPSNIGKGFVWYFICPHTSKRCRKLYLANTYFYHRSAFRGCMYRNQTESKINRLITQKYKPMYKGNAYDQLQEMYFKLYYNGLPTKKYLRIMKKIRKSESLPDHFLDKFRNGKFR